MESLRPLTFQITRQILKMMYKLGIAAVAVGGRGTTSLHLLMPDHRADLYLPKVIYGTIYNLPAWCLSTVTTCLHVTGGMKTSCDGSFSSYTCEQLLSPPGNSSAHFVSAVTWEDTSSWVSILRSHNLFQVLIGRRVKGKLHSPRFCLSNH